MKFFRSNYIELAIAFFIIFLIIAECSAPPAYPLKKIAISTLAAQGYENKIFMQLGFLFFGLTISLGLIGKGFNWKQFPTLIFGLSLAMTAVFCAIPIYPSPGIDYDERQSNFHLFFSLLAAISFFIAILLQFIFTTEKKQKLIQGCFLLIFILLGLFLKLQFFKSFAGIIQLLLFFVCFIWLIWFKRAPAKQL